MDETQIIVEQFFVIMLLIKKSTKKTITTGNINQNLTFDPLILACGLLFLFLIRKVYVSVDIAMRQCID